MEQQTIEETWEEILHHSAELASQRVRLTILPDKSTNSSTTETLDQKWLSRIYGATCIAEYKYSEVGYVVDRKTIL